MNKLPSVGNNPKIAFHYEIQPLFAGSLTAQHSSVVLLRAVAVV